MVAFDSRHCSFHPILFGGVEFPPYIIVLVVLVYGSMVIHQPCVKNFPYSLETTYNKKVTTLGPYTYTIRICLLCAHVCVCVCKRYALMWSYLPFVVAYGLLYHQSFLVVYMRLTHSMISLPSTDRRLAHYQKRRRYWILCWFCG
jgi:hypothetical protein